MKDRILFTIVGSSDPVKEYRDGPMLHIIRKYKPKKVLLFLTKTMLEIHELDNRYEIAIKSVDSSIEIEYIKRQDIDKPHIFGDWYYEFKNYINNEIEKNDNIEMLVNGSSGTPQLIMSLHDVVTHSNYPDIKFIQVESPKNNQYNSKNILLNFNLDNIYLNNDNDEYVNVNRCYAVDENNYNLINSVQLIKNLINTYDYVSAKKVLILVEKLINNDVKIILDIAIKLTQFNIVSMFETINQSKNSKNLIKIENEKTYLYIIKLNWALKRNEIDNFARAVTPLIDELFIIYLKNIHNFNIYDSSYSTKNSKGITELKINEINEKLGTSLNIKNMGHSTLMPILKKLENNEKIIKDFEDLQNFYIKIRNVITHQLTYIDNKNIDESVGYSAQGILNILKRINNLCHNKKYEYEILDTINKTIVKKLI